MTKIIEKTTPHTETYTEAVDELVAIAAAIASNCEPCLEYHVRRAREVDVADADIQRAVQTARKVKETPARKILRRADELLEAPAAPDATAGGCEAASAGTGPEPAARGADSAAPCC